MLWLGIHLPFRRVGAVNDYSYGIYVYGWPVSMLAVMLHLEKFGPLPFGLICLACTIPFAVASWRLIERRALAVRQPSRAGLPAMIPRPTVEPRA